MRNWDVRVDFKGEPGGCGYESNRLFHRGCFGVPRFKPCLHFGATAPNAENVNGTVRELDSKLVFGGYWLDLRVSGGDGRRHDTG